MKQSPEFRKAQENMKPGVITAEGFLGNDTRSLGDIISADEAEMQGLGLEFDVLVEQLRYLLDKGKQGLGEAITVDNTWIVRTDETRGTLPSPWEDGIFRKYWIEVELIENGRPGGKKLLYNDLSLHLIEKYHFFEGKGSSFRLEPRLAKEVLKL